MGQMKYWEIANGEYSSNGTCEYVKGKTSPLASINDPLPIQEHNPFLGEQGWLSRLPRRSKRSSDLETLNFLFSKPFSGM